MASSVVAAPCAAAPPVGKLTVIASRQKSGNVTMVVYANSRLKGGSDDDRTAFWSPLDSSQKSCEWLLGGQDLASERGARGGEGHAKR